PLSVSSAARQRLLQGEASAELAKSPQQRKVERRPHRLGPELLRERRVGRELPAVALELLGEKALEPAALVTAGLVVDHPARAALVHEAAIDHDAPESPGREPGEGQLARRLTVSGAEQPPSALVGVRASERCQDLPGRLVLRPQGTPATPPTRSARRAPARGTREAGAPPAPRLRRPAIGAHPRGTASGGRGWPPRT